MNALKDLLGGVGDIFGGITGLFNSPLWIEYAIIIGFMVVAIAMVGHFMRPGPRQWVAFGAILLGGGAALSWRRRKSRYNEKNLQKHNEAVKAILDKVEERNTIIKESNEKVRELEERKAKLDPGIKEDKQKISDLQDRIDNRKSTHRNLKASLDAQDDEIARRLEGLSNEQPLPSAADILAKYGISSEPPVTKPVIPDVSPQPDANITRIDNFVMKGDAS